MTVAPGGTLSNTRDTGRVFPVAAVAAAVAKEADATNCERITGPAGHATVVLSKPGVKVRNVESFATATGVASTGAAKKQYLTEGTDFSVNLADPAHGGMCTLTEVPNTDYSAQTWVVWYSPLAADGTIGGQNSVARNTGITP